MSLISERLKVIKPSPTLLVTQKASELKKAGHDIIALSVGEPDFDTPDNIKEAAILAIKQGVTKYTNVDGIPELKQAIKSKLQRENNLDYGLDEIIVSSGGKQVLYNLLMASLNKGDEVIIPVPYWVSYSDITLLAEGTPVFVNCDFKNDFKLTDNELENAITPKTKWLILNSPNNPSGSVYSHDELTKIAIILRKFPQINVISDDIYEHIVFNNCKFYSLANVAPDLKERVFIVNGVSKSYSMTGWRIGYGAGNKELVKAMTIIQSQSTSNASSISQMAAIEALNGKQDFIKDQLNEFEKKRDVTFKIMSNIQGIECNKPEGAFYLFPRCSSAFGRNTKSGSIIRNSNDFSAYLLEEAGVAVVPGIAFGLDEYFRLSYALSVDTLTDACLRIKKAVEELF